MGVVWIFSGTTHYEKLVGLLFDIQWIVCLACLCGVQRVSQSLLWVFGSLGLCFWGLSFWDTLCFSFFCWSSIFLSSISNSFHRILCARKIQMQNSLTFNKEKVLFFSNFSLTMATLVAWILDNYVESFLLSNVWIDRPLYRLSLLPFFNNIHAKSKTWFSTGKQRNK